MLAAGLRRDEHFDRLPHKLIARIAKNALCLKIDHFDSAGAIDHDKHIRRRFHGVLKPFQAVPELVFRLFLPREIPGQLHKASQLSRLVAHCGDNNMRPKARAILAYSPAFILEPVLRSRCQKLLLGPSAPRLIPRVEYRL
jgi:hypothetical protein